MAVCRGTGSHPPPPPRFSSTRHQKQRCRSEGANPPIVKVKNKPGPLLFCCLTPFRAPPSFATGTSGAPAERGSPWRGQQAVLVDARKQDVCCPPGQAHTCTRRAIHPKKDKTNQSVPHGNHTYRLGTTGATDVFEAGGGSAWTRPSPSLGSSERFRRTSSTTPTNSADLGVRSHKKRFVMTKRNKKTEVGAPSNAWGAKIDERLVLPADQTATP